MEHLDKKDIQGIIVRGYSNLPAACFLLIGVKDAEPARHWLNQIIPDVTPAIHRPNEYAVHVAFTFAGLKALELDKDALDSFPMEMEDGMTTRHKQFFLGDFGKSDNAEWEWGGKNTETVHIMLMLYAADNQILAKIINKYKNQLESHGLVLIKNLNTTVLVERKEHFGFHDGVAQPTIKGLDRDDDPNNIVAPGEFVLGYKNEYNQYTPTPQVAAAHDPNNHLPAKANGLRDLGLNGSYVVFRQLEQNVPLFWQFMNNATCKEDGTTDEEAMIKLASKIVGRWPSGAPMVLSPDADNERLKNNNNFDFRSADKDGLKCPFASHVRRSNPKDSLDTDRRTSISVANKHRILRRGRSYGKPVTENLKPADCLKAVDNGEKRGLHFICINADIARQFEFIQNAWINNPKFNGLYDERDPLVGSHTHPQDRGTTGNFSVQEQGLRKRYTGIPEFVHVKGGAYFFLPGINALRYLASMKPEHFVKGSEFGTSLKTELAAN